ncbi:protein kinase domain-containing protein [Psychrobacter sanguinis]|uniref:protein kinase domain-containing protein n=1 Tax=Psychrobacter sanguinis TaxID=861445 RepID=UPI0019187C0B|nr:protein kinase [Psychrobacter sanguinis]MCC3345083.1 protein kinase [Psychrobacter sanguinis]
MSYINDSQRQILIQAVNNQLTKQGYQIVKPIRLSRNWSHGDITELTELSYQDQTGYQGLTQVGCEEKDHMVKWQLLPIKSKCTSPLESEIANVRQLKQQVTNWPSCLLSYQFLTPSTLLIKSHQWRFDGLVMPFFGLGSLKCYLADTTLSAQIKLQLAIQMAESIQQLHHAGWIHGDIKPSNFLVSEMHRVNSQLNAKSRVVDNDSTEPVICLNDLAYAQQIGLTTQFGKISQLNKSTNIKDTNMAKISGTPAYLAPECWHGQPISIQSDLYAFGISLFELFAEQKPYSLARGAGVYQSSEENSKTAIIEKTSIEQTSAKAWARLHCQKEIPLLPYQWERLQPIIDKLLAKRIENRYQSIDEIIDVLQVLKNPV